MSFQVFLPFGPPAVLRLEVAEAVNGTDIKYTNHLNIDHKKSMLNDESRTYYETETSDQGFLRPSEICHHSPFRWYR